MYVVDLENFESLEHVVSGVIDCRGTQINSEFIEIAKWDVAAKQRKCVVLIKIYEFSSS